MATNTAATTARQVHTQQIHFLRKRITFADFGTTVNVGTIPAGASVVGGGVHVVTAFNSSGTDLLDVGFIGSTTDADGYATDLTLAAVGFIVLDELGYLPFAQSGGQLLFHPSSGSTRVPRSSPPPISPSVNGRASSAMPR